ncbi:hypothetical protein C2845_PM02G11110 [Panicum miliaceum]|uniref:50S ribosomal protein L18 n=1 Tax=Panicum miliaceum TaxID=4540 RepID=A0A3L6SCS6_PANMI|nr:hypothetical protein C2845_PM02G11110 [Panicum miliaceum]
MAVFDKGGLGIGSEAVRPNPPPPASTLRCLATLRRAAPPPPPAPSPALRPSGACSLHHSSETSDMVIPPPERAARVTRFLKPYLLRMHFSNKYVSAQVIHTPTATVACSASSQEKLLRPNMESTRDVSAAVKIGKLLGERLLLKGIPAVSIHMKREQKYHGKVKAVIDSVREAGVKLL